MANPQIGTILTSLFVAAAVHLTGNAAPPDKNQPYRIIKIPKREHGYSNFRSTVIRSQRELDDFLKKTSVQKKLGWNKRKQFIEAVKKAKVDFDKEALVLLRHTEGSGSIRILLGKPKLTSGKLICPIRRKVPQVGTADMAYYGFAIVIDKDRVQQIELRPNGRKKTILKP